MGRPAAGRTGLLGGRRARHQRGAAERARPRHARDALIPLGIEKGKPFHPEARQKAIL